MKTEITFKITLTPDYVEKLTGIEIPLDEWDLFCKEFESWFMLEYDETIVWMANEWENIKTGQL